MKKRQITVPPLTISTYNTLKKIRGNFGNLNPVTKVIPNRKHDYEYPDSYYDYYDEDDYIYEEEYEYE